MLKEKLTKKNFMEIVLRMTPIDWLIFLIAIAAHAPLIIGIIKKRDDTSQTFTTWGLYFLLDVINMFSTMEKNGSYVILFGFSVGSFLMSAILFYQKRINWTRLETVITFLVFLCIGAWYVSGPYWTIIFGIASETIVGIYLIIKTYRNPDYKYNLSGYMMFFIVSTLTMVTAKDLSIPQIGYAFTETILNIIIIIPLAKKWWIER